MIYVIFTTIPTFGSLIHYDFSTDLNGGWYGDGELYGSDIFIFNGMIEVFLLCVSIVLIHHLKIRYALLSGILCCILMGFNLLYKPLNLLFFPPSGYNYALRPSYYISLICWVTMCYVISDFTITELTEKKIAPEDIKGRILNLGTQFTRLEIREISEKCDFSDDLILKMMKSMIYDHEIYAEYFYSTRTVVFNQQANIEQFDNLLSKLKKRRKTSSIKCNLKSDFREKI